MTDCGRPRPSGVNRRGCSEWQEFVARGYADVEYEISTELES